MTEKKFSVLGMSCAACSSHVERAVKGLDGIESVEVSLMTASMRVIYREDRVNVEEIIAAVQKAGYSAAEMSGNTRIAALSAQNAVKLKRRTVLSAIINAILLYVSMGHMLGAPIPNIIDPSAEGAFGFALVQLLLTLPIIWLNRKFFIDGFSALLRGGANMNSLIAIGSGSAFVYGIYVFIRITVCSFAGDHLAAHGFAMELYFESAATILTLVLLGKALEAGAKKKTTAAIERVTALRPKLAMLVTENGEFPTHIENIKVGDIIAVRSGETVPADGVIIEGSASIDQSAITGESLPVDKTVGDSVTGATVNCRGFFKMRVTKEDKDSVLSEIISLMENAAAGKAPVARLADKVSGIFVPAVLIIAAVATVLWLIISRDVGFAIRIGVSVLVISCPCALGLATPVAVTVGCGRGAELGILIKNAEALERAGKISCVMLDKTGTVTEGKPKVTSFIFRNGCSIPEADVLKYAASAESLSTHVFAHSIVRYVNERQISSVQAENFTLIEGGGIICSVGEKRIACGNRRLMLAEAVKDFEPPSDQNPWETAVYIACEGEYCGAFLISDSVREDSAKAISELSVMGIQTVLLTGDRREPAEWIAEAAGVDTVYSELLPQDKERIISENKRNEKTVAMVGDGINDAPALMSADIGIAIGAGTDIAIESADIVLTGSSLSGVPRAIRLSRATMRVIKENLFWALFYNSVCIPIAAGVFYAPFGLLITPTVAALAMCFSSIFVVGNALRLFRLERNNSQELFESIYEDETKTETEKETEEEKEMIKEILIEGMMCMHCSGRVEKALNALAGVTATVDLEKKTAFVTLSKDSTADDETLIKTVTDAGYEVISIK